MPPADMARGMGLQRTSLSNTASDHGAESDCNLPESVCAVSRLPKMPPDPDRSLGGYLNYSGWPDRERFMELDRAIQCQLQESQQFSPCPAR